MKIAGLIVLGVGLLVAAVVAFMPVSTEVFGGGQADCGPPLLRYASQQQVDNQGEQNVIDKCEDESFPRVLIAGGITLGAVVVGGALILVSGRQPEEDI